MDRIVATSNNYLDSSEDLKTYKGKSTVIPLGVDETKYPRIQETNTRFWQNKLGSDFFLFVGVLRQYKGLHILLEAARKTKHNVVIVGSGPTERALRKQIAEQNIGNVILTGFLSEEDKVVLFNLCRAVIFPSHQRAEAFGVTLIEGAMFGKPLISTELGTGTSYVNKDNVTGLVVQANDSTGLANAMNTLAENDALVHSMGRAARIRFEELFSPEKMGQQYIALYLSVLENCQKDSFFSN